MNGVTVLVDQFSEELSENHNVLLFTPSYSLRSTTIQTGNLTHKRIRSLPFPVYPGIHAAIPNIIGIYRMLRKFKPDVIHIHTPFVLGILGSLLAQVMGVKLVNTYHTLLAQGSMYLSPKRLLPGQKLESCDPEDDGLLSQIIWRLQVLFFNSSDAVIAPTEVIAKTLRQRGIKSLIKVLPGGLPVDGFPIKDSFEPTHKVIHLGRLGFEKETDVILKAFALVLKKVPDAKLVLAGDGPARGSLEEEAKTLGISKSVTFLGMVPHTKAAETYRTCDIFVTASTFETQGLVLIEAMLSGLPTIAPAVNAPVDLITPGVNGYLFSEKDYVKCAEYLTTLLVDGKLLKKMGLAAANMVKPSTAEN